LFCLHFEFALKVAVHFVFGVLAVVALEVALVVAVVLVDVGLDVVDELLECFE
jgi:hypothetical protein